MSATFNLSLPEEMRAFIDSNSGDGTLYATPSEFLRGLIREKMERLEAAKLRQAVLGGFQDAIEGRHVDFNGSIADAIAEAERRDAEGWK